MRILGIDTATPVASVALIDDDQLISEQNNRHSGSTARSPIAPLRPNHAETLLSLIESVLGKARILITDVSGIAVSIGPGSFTGLRIGLSTVKGLAYGWGIPVVGISTLLANAARAADFNGLICSLLDAKKNEVYASLFRRNGKELARLTDDLVAPIEAVIDSIRAMHSALPCLFIGDGTKVHETLLLDAFGDNVHLSMGDSYHSIASLVARLSVERFCRSEAEELGQFVPIYLRPSEAQAKRKIRP